MASNLSPPFRTLKVCTIRWGLDVRASTFFARHCRRDVLNLLAPPVSAHAASPSFASVWQTCHTKRIQGLKVQQPVNRTTTPTTATYESGQRPSIVPLHLDPSLVVAY